MPRGIGTRLRLGDTTVSPTVWYDVSTYLDKVDGQSSPERLDDTNFQPGVAAPLKIEVAGFRTRGFSLGGKWRAAGEIVFTGLEGKEGLLYEYGPVGSTVGSTKVTGTCNFLSYTGPQSSVSGVITMAGEIGVTSRTVATYDGAEPATTP